MYLFGSESDVIGRLLPEAIPLDVNAVSSGDFIVAGFRHPGAFDDQVAWVTECRNLFVLVQKSKALLVPVDLDHLATDPQMVAKNLQRRIGLRETVIAPTEATPTMKRTGDESSIEALTFYGKMKFNVNYAPFGVIDWSQGPYPLEEDVRCNLCGGAPRTLVKDAQCTGQDFVECSECGFGYFSPRVAYSEEFKKAVSNGGQFTKWTLHCKFLDTFYGAHAIRLNELSQRPTKSILDVGCGDGYALSVFRSHWPDAKLVGCDISKWATDFAEGNRGVQCVVGSFDDLTKKDLGMHDIVTCFNFIEHTFTPLEDIKMMVSRVRKDGLLLIQTFLTELDPDYTMMSPPWHTGHFTEEHLVRLAESFGVKIVSSKSAGILWTGVFRK